MSGRGNGSSRAFISPCAEWDSLPREELMRLRWSNACEKGSMVAGNTNKLSPLGVPSACSLSKFPKGTMLYLLHFPTSSILLPKTAWTEKRAYQAFNSQLLILSCKKAPNVHFLRFFFLFQKLIPSSALPHLYICFSLFSTYKNVDTFSILKTKAKKHYKRKQNFLQSFILLWLHPKNFITFQRSIIKELFAQHFFA